MLIIEKNAVYEVDCECLQKKRGRYANLTCEERQIEKEQIIVPTGGVCKESLSYTGKGVTVAILDTGLYPHPDFKDRILSFRDFSNTTGSSEKVLFSFSHFSPLIDNSGHGTHVAGIIADKTDMEHRKEEISVAFFTKVCYSVYNRCLQRFRTTRCGE